MATPNPLLELIGTGTQEYIGASQNAQTVQIENAKKAEEAAKRAEATFRQVADDSALIEFQKGTSELQAQNALRNTAVAGGIDPTTGAGYLRDRIALLNKKSAEARALMLQRRQELDVNMITNPLGWIKAQVDWNSTGHNLTTVVQELELADKDIGAMNKALQETARTTELVKETHTTATIEARSRIAKAQATLQAEQAAIEGFKQNSNQVLLAEKGSAERLGALYNQFNAQRLEAQHQLALEQFDQNKVEWNQRQADKRIEAAAKAADKTVDEMTAEFMNLSRIARGLQPLNPIEIQTRLHLYKKGQSAEAAYDVANGERIKLSGGVPMIASSPAEAVEVLAKLPSNLPEMRREVAALIGQIAEEFDLGSTPEARKAKASGGDEKVGRPAYINARARQVVADQFARVDGPSNIFYVGDISTFIGGKDGTGPGITSLQLLPTVSKILLPASQRGVELTSPTVVMGLIIDGIMKGEITSSQAASNVAEIYRRANEITQAGRALPSMGIIPPKAGKGYNVRLGGFSGVNLDLTNPVDITNYIGKQLAVEAYKGRAGGTEFRGQRTSPVTGQPYGR